MLPVQQQNTASTATKTRFDLLIENAPQACAALRAGRRGRRFKSCHPDQYSRRPEALPLPGGGLRFGPYRNGAHRNSSEGPPPACAALRWPPSIWSAHRSPTSSSTQFQAATGTGRLVSGRPSAGRLSAPVSQPRAARAIETASTAAAPARCRSCHPGGAFNRALTMPREAVATTRATSAAASARAPDGTDQCRQACTAKVSRAVPASTATARWIRCRATIPPGWPDGQSGKLAQAFSASALTTTAPETNNTPAALMAVQPSLPSRRPVVGRKGTRAATAVIVAPASMARAASRCAATVGAPLPDWKS